MRLAIDPWADGPLEPATAPIAPKARLTPTEVEQIDGLVRSRQFDDHGLIPEVHAIEFKALSVLAQAGNPTAVAALRRVHQRADFGGPLSEPHEPAWSLDPERRGPSRGE